MKVITKEIATLFISILMLFSSRIRTNAELKSYKEKYDKIKEENKDASLVLKHANNILDEDDDNTFAAHSSHRSHSSHSSHRSHASHASHRSSATHSNAVTTPVYYTPKVEKKITKIKLPESINSTIHKGYKINDGYVSFGYNKKEVIEILGTPDKIDDDTWRYGVSSYVKFSDDGYLIKYKIGYPSINVKLYYKYVISTRLNVRSGPSTKNKVLAQLKKGDIVLILGEKNKWYKVRYNKNEYGWTYKSLISK